MIDLYCINQQKTHHISRTPHNSPEPKIAAERKEKKNEQHKIAEWGMGQAQHE
jgi:hypothetical protein